MATSKFNKLKFCENASTFVCPSTTTHDQFPVLYERVMDTVCSAPRGDFALVATNKRGTKQCSFSLCVLAVNFAFWYPSRKVTMVTLKFMKVPSHIMWHLNK